MSEEKPAWAMMPNETERQFRAFQLYLHMLDDPEEKRRSIHRLALSMGYSTKKALEKWSSQNNWIGRARAYDDYMSVAIVQREIHNLGAFQEHVVESLTTQLALLDRILNKELSQIIRDQDKDKAVASQDIKRIVDAVKAKDDLARRVARMPTNYMSAHVDDDEEQMTYIVGDE